jgi:hypothetical protein
VKIHSAVFSFFVSYASGNEITHDLAALQAGESDTPATADDSEVFMIKTEQMQDRRMQVAKMHRSICNDTTIVARLAMGVTGFDTATGHPEGEGAMLVTGLVLILARFETRTAKLTAPDHERVL